MIILLDKRVEAIFEEVKKLQEPEIRDLKKAINEHLERMQVIPQVIKTKRR